jgi:CBS domain-containing protein
VTTAADILKSKPNQAIFAIGPRASVYDALKLAADKGVGALLVMEDERVIGIVTERDYARKVAVMDEGKLLGLISIGDLVKDIISEQQFIIQQLQHYIAGERA